MNTIKRISIAFLVFAMVTLLCVPTFAAELPEVESVEYVLSVEGGTEFCVPKSDKNIVIEIKPTEEISLMGLDAKITVPKGWEVTMADDNALGLTDDDYDSKEGVIMWFNNSIDYDTPVTDLNKKTTSLLKLNVTVPETVDPGSYNITITDMVLFSILVDNSGNYTENIETPSFDTVNITVKDHDFAHEVVYTWNEDDFECTADGNCACGETATATATVESKVTIDPTCTKKGTTTYTATFEEAWAETQTQDVQNVDMNPENHASEEITYIDTAGKTHTVKHTCCDATDAPVEHTYDQDNNTKCVCGAEKPGQTTGLKGDYNFDNRVGAEDLTMLARHAVGIESIENVPFEYLDLNGNGRVDAEDVTIHARYAVGIITEWP